MLTGPIPKCGKADIRFKHKYFVLVFFPKIPLPPPNVFRDSYKKKESVFRFYTTKYRSTRSVNSTQSILPFDFKTLWTLDEGSEKDNNMFNPLWHPEESCGHPGQHFITCI